MPNLDAWLARTAYPPGDRSAEAQRRIDKAQSIYDSTLRDVCILQTRREGDTDYGYGKAKYRDCPPVPCLFLPVAADESAGAQAQGIDGEIRLPRNLSISNLARVKITKLYGRSLNPPQVYEIIGGPIQTHVGHTAKVKLVMDGSET